MDSTELLRTQKCHLTRMETDFISKARPARRPEAEVGSEGKDSMMTGLCTGRGERKDHKPCV